MEIKIESKIRMRGTKTIWIIKGYNSMQGYLAICEKRREEKWIPEKRLKFYEVVDDKNE